MCECDIYNKWGILAVYAKTLICFGARSRVQTKFGHMIYYPNV